MFQNSISIPGVGTEAKEISVWMIIAKRMQGRDSESLTFMQRWNKEMKNQIDWRRVLAIPRGTENVKTDKPTIIDGIDNNDLKKFIPELESLSDEKINLFKNENLTHYLTLGWILGNKVITEYTAQRLF